MVCKNCGAEFDGNLIKCPFCGAENVEESYRRQREYVDDLKKKSDFLAALPNWITMTLGKAMSHMAVVAVVLFLVILLIAFIGAKIYSSTSVWRMERQIAKLEELYVAGDYEKLEDIYWDMDDTYGGTYEKYYRTADIYSRVDRIMYCMEKLSGDFVEYVNVADVEDMLEDLMDTLHDIEVMEQDGFLYDEGEAMLTFQKTLLEGVEKHIPMSEEEFETAYDKYLSEEENDYSKEAELILQRAIEASGV